MTVNTVLFLETKSVLAALKDSGARIGIISTKFRYRIKELLDQHFPEDFLDIIIGGEDVQTPKPSPEGLLLAIRQLHATKAETLYIGDSTVDAETAQKAGVDFAGITHGMTTAEELKKYPHKKIMSSLEELLEREPLPAAASPRNISVRRIALLLLLFGYMQKDLDHGEAVGCQIFFPVCDLLITLFPDVLVNEIPRKLPLVDQIMNARHDDVFILRTVENADSSSFRERAIDTPEIIMVQFFSRRLFERIHLASLFPDESL